MKNFIKSYVFIFLLIIVNSCSKSNDPVEGVPDDNLTYTGGIINVEGVTGLDNSSLTVQSFNNSAQVNSDGSFEVNQDISDDTLPLIFLKDGEIIFGYFQKDDVDDKISVDDMLLFYFSLHPEIARQGFLKSELLNKIKSDTNYTSLKELIVNSLDSNSSPFKNETFVSRLNASGYSIGIEARGFKFGNIKKGNGTDIFKYTYTREGTVSWPSEFPVFCTIGLEIINTETQESSGPQILDKKGLVLSAGSGIKYIYDYFTTDESEKTGTFQFPSEGQYDIKFTNGVDNFGTTELESKVDRLNRVNLGIDIVSFMIPIGIEKVLGKAACRDAMISFFQNVTLTGIKSALFFNGILNKVEAEKELFDISNKIYDEIVKCALDGKGFSYIDKIKAIGETYLNKIEDGASIVLFLRDYLLSDIKGSETRYYYDEVSFGELSQKNISGLEYINSSGNTEFTGASGSEHKYIKQVEEKVFEYNIERGLITSSSTQSNKQELTIGIPFSLTKTNLGDATVKEVNNSIETRLDGTIIGETTTNGNLDVTFIMGSVDSEFEIKPQFKNSGLSTESITLKNELFVYEGDWYLLFYNDLYNPYEEAKFTFDANGESTKVETSSTQANGGVTIYEDAPDYYTISMSYNDSNNTLGLTYNYWPVTYYFPVNSTNDNIFYTSSNNGFFLELRRL